MVIRDSEPKFLDADEASTRFGEENEGKDGLQKIAGVTHALAALDEWIAEQGINPETMKKEGEEQDEH